MYCNTDAFTRTVCNNMRFKKFIYITVLYSIAQYTTPANTARNMFHPLACKVLLMKRLTMKLVFWVLSSGSPMDGMQ
jgi:hypothetical protein